MTGIGGFNACGRDDRHDSGVGRFNGTALVGRVKRGQPLALVARAPRSANAYVCLPALCCGRRPD